MTKRSIRPKRREESIRSRSKGSDIAKHSLLLNGVSGDHARSIGNELRTADQLIAMVGFAKWSASRMFLDPLKSALDRGMRTKIAVGLSLYVTDPKLLWELLELTRQHKTLEVYISRLNKAGRTDKTFHPKIYAFQGESGHTIVVGSANMTRGGLASNHEASLVVREGAPSTFLQVAKMLDSLRGSHLVEISSAGVEQYERLHQIYAQCWKNARNKAKEIVRRDAPQLADLRDSLKKMRSDSTRRGWRKQMSDRKAGREAAVRAAKRWASVGGDRRTFLEQFEGLVGNFHSAGLQRGKTKAMTRPKKFHELVKKLSGTARMDPEEAYNSLNELIRQIPGTGPNLLTELLHAVDPKKFAVMNKRSVSVLRANGAPDMPSLLNKKSVSGSDYANFCRAAGRIRRELKLVDFTQIDALLNYNYEEPGSAL